MTRRPAMSGMLLLLLLSAACAGTSASKRATTRPRGEAGQELTPVLERTHDVQALFTEDPEGIDELFAANFLAKVPEPQVKAIFTQLHQQLGTCTGVSPDPAAPPPTETSGKFILSFDSGFTAPISLTVDPAPPHRIVGLWIGNPVPAADTLESVLDELKSLPGTTSFRLVRLTGAGAAELDEEVIAEHNPDQPLAIGSAFKLYVLSELVRTVKGGERAWSQVVPLSAEALSLPSGFLQSWPVESPLTLHTLAGLMISQSDNTATDMLLRTLGRGQVEAILPLTGLREPQLDRPFLGTLEASKLKFEPSGELADRYLALDDAGKRAFLEEELPSIPTKSLRLTVAPSHIETLEWFASTSDLCRVMDWLRRESEEGEGAEARKILAINPGLPSAVERFRYVGFKGGSEPGVMNLTYLLQVEDGSYYALSSSWNDPAAPLNENRFAGLVARALLLVPNGGESSGD